MRERVKGGGGRGARGRGGGGGGGGQTGVTGAILESHISLGSSLPIVQGLLWMADRQEHRDLLITSRRISRQSNSCNGVTTANTATTTQVGG